MKISTEHKTVVELDRADLHESLKTIDLYPRLCGATEGRTRVVYTDQYDTFEMLLQPSNLGYSVSCRLNGGQSYQLNGQIFNRDVEIGEVMLAAAGAPALADVEGFFS